MVLRPQRTGLSQSTNTIWEADSARTFAVASSGVMKAPLSTCRLDGLVSPSQSSPSDSGDSELKSTSYRRIWIGVGWCGLM